jgi:hypothetical protein
MYHKGYHILGSTKIIHRYLPHEVSKLIIYYLWLVLPFRELLELMALGQTRAPSRFLWSKGEDSWEPGRLRAMLAREAEAHLGTKMNISLYRHAAIAFSRVHLPCGGFKRDYGVNDSYIDQQGGHTSWTAGTVYARGLQEAPGHVEGRQIQYRAISREWHGFLGFGTHPSPRKQAGGDRDGPEGEMAAKRTCITINLNTS